MAAFLHKAALEVHVDETSIHLHVTGAAGQPRNRPGS